MAAIEPPYACQGRTDHPASLFRIAHATSTGAPFAVGGTSPLGGVDPYFGAACAVTGLASMNVQIGTGVANIPSTTAWNGMYVGYNTANFNVSIAAASATQWRTDRVDAVVVDPGDATANWNAVVTTGTFASSSPGATPAAPANSVPLALIRVVPNMTVTNGGGTVIDNRLINGLKGVWPTTSTAKPSLSAPEGTMWFETDTNLLGIIVSGAYQYIPIGLNVADPWHSLGSFGLGWTIARGRYRFTADGELEIDISLTGTGVPGGLLWPTTLPSQYRPAVTKRIPGVPDTGAACHTTISTGGVVTSQVPSGAATFDSPGRVALD